MKYPVTPHNGICSFCKSKVDMEAITCKECGAVWWWSRTHNLHKNDYYYERSDFYVGRIYLTSFLLLLAIADIFFLHFIPLEYHMVIALVLFMFVYACTSILREIHSIEDIPYRWMK